MKKLLIAFGVLFIMSGCDDNATDTLSCSNTTTANGVTTMTTYDIKYQDDDVKYVTITYDYSQDANNMNDDMDGVNADTDGSTENTDNNTGNMNSDDVVDGVVGDVVDGTVDTVTDTILDLAGIKNTYENQMSTYDNLEGFSYNVDADNDNKYVVTYEIDMDKMNDSDLATFNVTRNFSDIRNNYEDLGYTCK